MSDADVSILVPAKDEVNTIVPLIGEIVTAMADRPDLRYEIVFIDDGSSDGTWEQIEAAAVTTPTLSAIRFGTSLGKAAALSAGLENVTGRIIITMDADMQDDPSELPRLLEQVENGYDLVTGYKKVRRDPLGKRLPSKLFNRVTGAVTGLKLNDHNSGLRVGKREVYDAVPIYGELHRYVPALAHAKGFKVCEMAVNHRPRLHGRSKYGLERYARGALDLLTVVSITKYGRRPSHLLGGFGLIFGLIGSLILLYLLGVWVFTDNAIGTRPILQLGILLEMLAVQLVGMGLLAELIIHRTNRSLDASAPVASLNTSARVARPLGTPTRDVGPASPAVDADPQFDDRHPGRELDRPTQQPIR